MSLVNDNRVHSRTEAKLKDKATLFISNDIIDKIDHLHREVTKGTEWSAILIYDTKEGDINDPKNWVLEVKDIIPMDVGNATYTEYNITGEDTYAFSRWSDALMEGKKMGHLHTHHNMKCFFSGTDTSELHDNAPNHNYYLSLIVNYDDPKAWMAKIAICGEVVRKGKVNTTRSWSAEEGNIDKEVEIDETLQLLYTIDLDLEIEPRETTVSQDFADRVKELDKKKGRSYAYTGFHQGGSPPSYLRRIAPSVSVAKGREKKEGILENVLEMQGSDFFTEEEEEQVKFGYSNEEANFYSPGAVKPFLSKLLMQDMHSEEELATIFINLSSELAVDRLIDKMEDTIEDMALRYFKIPRIGSIDLHCITVSILDNIVPFENTYLYEGLKEMLQDYLLPEEHIKSKEVKRLTGIELLITN